MLCVPDKMLYRQREILKSGPAPGPSEIPKRGPGKAAKAED
jgi:hypothetical protein